MGFYSAYDTTPASAAARGALSSGGVPHSTRLCCLVTGAPASSLALRHSQCMRIPLLIFAGAAALFVSSSRPPPRRHRPARRAVMADIAPGSRDWWPWAAENGLDVKLLCGAAPKTTPTSRREARKAGLRDEETKEVGWNATKLPGMKGKLCYWHTSNPTRFTTRKMDLLAKLGRAAPKQKRTKKRGFSSSKLARRNATQKREKTDRFADDYQEPHEARERRDNRNKCREAAAGRQIGTSPSAKSKIFNEIAFLGELYALMYIGLFNPNIRPLICVCELWWLLERHDIECEFERWYGWMEDMWWCTNGSVAGSGGIAGRLIKLGLGTYKNTDGWPEVKHPANMKRVEALLGVSEGYLRGNGVGPFYKTYLPEKPGLLVYQIHHASRPPWWSRTSCWHRLVATLRNLRRPEDQIFPGRLFKGRAFKPKPDGSEWFAGAGPWCLSPIMRRAALLKIDGSALAPAGFSGPQRTIVIMSLASLYKGRPMYVRHGAEPLNLDRYYESRGPQLSRRSPR